MRLDNRVLGNSKPKNSWQDWTISILPVLKSFIKNRLIVKSSEAIWDLVSIWWREAPRGLSATAELLVIITRKLKLRQNARIIIKYNHRQKWRKVKAIHPLKYVIIKFEKWFRVRYPLPIQLPISKLFKVTPPVARWRHWLYTLIHFDSFTDFTGLYGIFHRQTQNRQ